jgi:hypothetical protein
MRGAIAALAILLALACGGGSSTASATPSPTAQPSPQARPSGQLDAGVPMPAGFPGDLPIYPKARLTAGAGFPSSGPTAWGMEWQTLDSVDKVRVFYADKLNQGDWSITFTEAAGGSFSATFNRKSNPQVQGTLKSNVSVGVTKILMSLVSPA